MKNDIKLDFSAVVDNTKPVDADWYYTIIKSFELKKAENGKIEKQADGKWPYFNACFEITEGQFAGRRVYSIFTTNPEQAASGNNSKNFMLFNLLRCLGLVKETGEVKLDPENIINRELMVEFGVELKNKDEQDDPNAEKRNNVRKFKPAV